jgi:hypothetical protein
VQVGGQGQVQDLVSAHSLQDSTAQDQYQHTHVQTRKMKAMNTAKTQWWRQQQHKHKQHTKIQTRKLCNSIAAS